MSAATQHTLAVALALIPGGCTKIQTPVEAILGDLAPGTQVHDVLRHMLLKETITQVEAHELYRVYRLASRITDLRAMGVLIVATRVNDLTGKRYTRYSLAK